MPQKKDDEINKDDLDSVLDSGSDIIEDDDEEEAFNAGFDEDTTRAHQQKEDEPEPEPEPAPEPEPKAKSQEPEPAPEPEPEEDNLNKRLRSMEGRYGQFNDDLRTIKSTINSLKDALEQSRQNAVDEGRSAPTKKEIAEALKSSEKMEALREEYPEIAETMDEIRLLDMETMKEAVNQEVEARAKAIISSGGFVSKQEVEDMKVQWKGELQLDIKHPGWQDTFKQPEFQDWFNALDAERREKVDTDYSETIKMLDDYKAYAKESASRQAKSNRLKNAVTPTKSKSEASVSTSMTEDEAFEAEFNKA